ncbi:hypothetical protein AMJ39_00900 [candidate division TA06 bacterium DG_24]|uniref:Fis family transcriptional regulator n=2 Tax=Bacteria division TA06 TaxID=1156500 RepID=A0A0S8GF70_UNCT6|nr:MAG: hypothetical protein AMJ39_00900 [candidate division TA06 bacterium DG_24]KPK71679.1 MAG: hypothetical protein AMJ82_00270 [candidate division TA06 bacterium SM23_40]
MGEILIVDDERSMRKALSVILRQDGHHVGTASSGREALRKLGDRQYDVVVTDMKMDRIGGFEVLREVKRVRPDTEVIMVTAFGTIELAVEAIKQGAYDYITKPFDADEIKSVVKRAEARRALLQRVRHPEVAASQETFGILGRSEAMLEVFRMIRVVAPTDTTVLICGESGTGKELVARAIHASSKRHGEAFVTVNCGALPEHLLESEMFGHAKGSFSGAISEKKGLFEEADGGALFLDEVGETSPAIQVKLLRVLQDGEVRPVGENRIIHVDVRIIAATNCDLQEAVMERRFREDLFYRLNVVPIHLPPLRERRADIPLLASHFLTKYRKNIRDEVRGISPQAIRLLQQYEWPGNVRELENVIERAVILSQSDEITVKELPVGIRNGEAVGGGSGEGSTTLKDIEMNHIIQVLHECNGNQAAAARRLSIGRTTLWRKLRSYNLSPDGESMGNQGGYPVSP